MTLIASGPFTIGTGGRPGFGVGSCAFSITGTGGGGGAGAGTGAGAVVVPVALGAQAIATLEMAARKESLNRVVIIVFNRHLRNLIAQSVPHEWMFRLLY